MTVLGAGKTCITPLDEPLVDLLNVYILLGGLADFWKRPTTVWSFPVHEQRLC